MIVPQWLIVLVLIVVFGCVALISRDNSISGIRDGAGGKVVPTFHQSQSLTTSDTSSCPPTFQYNPQTDRLRHYHQHKAGGKTVNYILERIKTANNDGSDPSQAPLFTRANGGEIHGNRKSLHQHMRKGESNDRYVTFLREPTAKVMSRFYYHRTMCNGTSWMIPCYKLAGVCCLTLEDYVVQRAMNNNQYESLVAGMSRGKVCSPNHPDLPFEKDWEAIRRGKLTPNDVCPNGGWEGFVGRVEEILLDLSDRGVFFGIVEEWDTSLLLLGEEGGFDPSSMVYCHKNAKAGSPKPKHLADGIWGPKGKKALAVLKEYNALDIATYEATRRIFDRKIKCWEDASKIEAISMASETKQWQTNALASFQEEHCGSGTKLLNRTYRAPVFGIRDATALADPNFAIPSDLHIMISREEEGGNRTCPQLLEEFDECPFPKPLEAC